MANMKTAVNHYRLSLLKKVFSKLKIIWFEERVQWRLLLRARVHYYTKLKYASFSRWKCYIMKKKQNKIKQQIADYFYKNRLKHKCLDHLRYLPTFNATERLIVQSAIRYKIFSYLYIHILRIHSNYYHQCLEYYINIMHHRAFQKRALKYYFKKLQMYTEKGKLKQSHNRLIELYRQANYNPKLLAETLQSWITFTRTSLVKREKMNIVNNHLKKKLTTKYLTKLHNYAIKKTRKNTEKQLTILFYEKSLLQKCFKFLLTYNRVQKLKCFKMEGACTFFTNKLLQKCLKKIVEFKNRKQYSREICSKITVTLTMKIQRKYFTILQNYYNVKVMSVKRYKIASDFYTRKLQKRAFQILLAYGKCRARKLILRENLLAQIRKVVRLSILQTTFQGWLAFCALNEEKRVKVNQAEKHYQHAMLVRATHLWILFVTRMNMAKQKIQTAELVYSLNIKQRAFRKLKINVHEKRQLKINLNAVEEFNRKHLIRSGIRIILTSAFHLYDQREKRASHKFHREYFLASKYFGMWKKCLPKIPKTQCPTMSYECMSFQWNPICFSKPKIPKYLKTVINE